MPFLISANLAAPVAEPVEATYLAPPVAEPVEATYLADVIALVAPRMRLLSDAPALVAPFVRDPEAPEDAGRAKWLSGEAARERLRRAAAAFSTPPEPVTIANAEELTNRVAEEMGTARAPVIHTLRVATTGTTVGPGLFETLALLGRERIVRRLVRALDWVVN
jgi:glutamyl-tRNA synthetase